MTEVQTFIQRKHRAEQDKNTKKRIKEYLGNCADIKEVIELNLKIKTRNKKVVFINPNNNSNKKVFSKKKTRLIDISERINE